MTETDRKLNTLYNLLVDNFGTLKKELIALIAEPEQIENTNKFASLLSQLKEPAFVNPLVLKISGADWNDPWLSDYLYATINLLAESSVDEEFYLPDNLIEKLGLWIMNNPGELSWKAAGVLKYIGSAEAEDIQLKKLEGCDDLFLTYVECILGLLKHDEAKHIGLVREIAQDGTRDEKLREFCLNIVNRTDPAN